MHTRWSRLLIFFHVYFSRWWELVAFLPLMLMCEHNVWHPVAAVGAVLPTRMTALASIAGQRRNTHSGQSGPRHDLRSLLDCAPSWQTMANWVASSGIGLGSLRSCLASLLRARARPPPTGARQSNRVRSSLPELVVIWDFGLERGSRSISCWLLDSLDVGAH